VVTYALHDLTDHIRQVLALNFGEPLWITAEVSHCGLSRGHYYLDLVQKNDSSDEPIAQASAMLWAQDLRRLQRTAAIDPILLLQSGLQLRMQVRVDFHERFGLKLQILDIDSAFTYGQIELERQKNLLALKQMNLLGRNANLPLPLVLQRIAVLSSDNAAGYQDFQAQLRHNDFGYAFELTLFPCAVQGRNAAPELVAALETISPRSSDFDVVVIVRGGGAKLDLAPFDQLDLARAVATMSLPVLCGIGHETDSTVLDQVAHKSLKTPTATADFILQRNLMFENAILHCAELIQQQGRSLLHNALRTVEQVEANTRFSIKALLNQKRQELDHASTQLPQLAQHLLRTHQQELQQAEALCRSLDPRRILQRGFSISYKNGKPLKAASEAQAGDHIETILAEGTIRSKVILEK
jgi:exodeoxyribonuclease VII large subunit